PAVSTSYSNDGRSLVMTFDKAMLSGLPSGESVPFTVTGHFNRYGLQWPIGVSTSVKVLK
ncbi:MAG TPA: hypothetical protein VK570_15215, partial [Rubrivivax sp.]|nr:hypothetical protein [Rubrivivax sp.]